MPAAGRKPNEGQPIRHRNKPAHEWTEVDHVYFDDPPPLPRPAAGERSWPTQTKRWWKAVSHMPHCILWDDADWQFAIDTALVAAAFHAGNIKAATELRQREKVMGTTVDARRDLRIRYVDPVEVVDDPAVTAMADYKQRLGQ